MRLHIAQIGPGILPIPAPGYGAIEKHIDHLSKQLRKNGHDVRILNDVIGEYHWAIRVGRILRDTQFDIVHVHTAFLAGYLTRFADLKQRIVYTSHSPYWGIDFNLGPLERWGMFWEKNAVRHATVVIALTDRLQKTMSEFRDDVCIVVPNGVDCELFARREGRNGTRVCMLGKIVPRKRMDVVASAMQDVPNGELHIIGPVVNRDYARLISKTNPRTMFHSGLMETDMAKELGMMDIFVHASEAEAMSMAVLEGMASELPIVHSARSCAVEIIGSVGIEIPWNDHPTDYAQAINRLLDDPELRRHLEMKARSIAMADYSWEKVAAGVERAYEAAGHLPP